MRNASLKTVYELASENQEVLFLGSDLGPTTLSAMKQEFPDRFFMEGISEQHILGMAAGLAMNGFIPFVNTIASFLTRRCFENIVVDLCMHDLPVRLIGNGAGGVYAPLGPTHQAIEDIAILRTLPNMTILAPCDAIEAQKLIKATVQWPHPVYIRLAKGGDKIITNDSSIIKIGQSLLKQKPGDILLVTTGVMTQIALEVSEILSKEDITCGVLHFSTIKPLDPEILKTWIPKVKTVITIEEHLRSGGLGSAILEFTNDFMPEHVIKIHRFGIDDNFAQTYGSQRSLWEAWGIDTHNIIKKMRAILKLKEQ